MPELSILSPGGDVKVQWNQEKIIVSNIDKLNRREIKFLNTFFNQVLDSRIMGDVGEIDIVKNDKKIGNLTTDQFLDKKVRKKGVMLVIRLGNLGSSLLIDKLLNINNQEGNYSILKIGKDGKAEVEKIGSLSQLKEEERLIAIPRISGGLKDAREKIMDLIPEAMKEMMEEFISDKSNSRREALKRKIRALIEYSSADVTSLGDLESRAEDPQPAVVSTSER